MSDNKCNCNDKCNSNNESTKSNNVLESLVGILFSIAFLFTYLAGWVIAKGFWENLAAIIPIVPFYFVVREILRLYGIT